MSTATSEQTAEVLDLRGLKCPLPALMTRRALLLRPPHTILEVACDDPLCGIDIPHMCAEENIEVLREARAGAVLRLWLRRRDDAADDVLRG